MAITVSFNRFSKFFSGVSYGTAFHSRHCVEAYKYTYLLTDQFLVDRYVWQFYGITAKPGGVKFFLLQGLECYKNTQIKAYDNTTNRPRSNISVTL